MKKWRCTVCGYVHTGEEPPESCPVCGADASMFEEVVDESGVAATAAAPESGGEDSAPAAGPRKWRCTVCGYVATGDAPPDTCPVCGADAIMFEEVVEAPAAPAPAEESSGAAAGPLKWRCTVCGYVHTGDEPPDTCPVCGADRSLFEAVGEAAPQSVTAETPAADAQPDRAQPTAAPRPAGPPSFGRWDPWLDRMGKLHAHPIAVHIPNGVLPVAVVMLFLSALFGSTVLSRAALCNLVFVVLSMPVVLFTGWVDWQRRFGGHLTTLFRVKIACGALVSLTALVLTVWMLFNPDVVLGPAGQKVPFLLTAVGMLGAAATAGFFGGKLVFRD